MTADEAKKKIDTDPDFIFSKRFNNSLKKCLERFPEGAPNKVIAQCLIVTEDEVELIHTQVIEKLRKIMKV